MGEPERANTSVESRAWQNLESGETRPRPSGALTSACARFAGGVTRGSQGFGLLDSSNLLSRVSSFPFCDSSNGRVSNVVLSKAYPWLPLVVEAMDQRKEQSQSQYSRRCCRFCTPWVSLLPSYDIASGSRHYVLLKFSEGGLCPQVRDLVNLDVCYRYLFSLPSATSKSILRWTI